MSISIVRAGILDTVQDIGRFGYGKWGVNPGGAMDRFAAQSGNALVGNDSGEAVIELHFPASEFIFNEDTLISLTGGDFGPHIGSRPVPLWKAIAVKKDSVLSFKYKKSGTRCYLCVHGSYQVPRWLGSASTNLKISAGGFQGRPLRKGDNILPGRQTFSISADEPVRIHSWTINTHPVYREPEKIFFIEGNEYNWMAPESKETMLSESFRIETSSDRMAYYLKHLPLELSHREELLSSAVTFGTLQLLPNGNLIVLMADHQTTGGYPRIGHVISAHHPKLAQLNGGQSFQFHKITIDEAEKLVFSLQHDLQIMQKTCREKLETFYGQH
jgi:antagonist of KipI